MRASIKVVVHKLTSTYGEILLILASFIFSKVLMEKFIQLGPIYLK